MTKMLALAPSCRLMTTRWPSGENRGAEAHAGKVADDLALTGLDVEQINARVALAVGHVGDLLGRRRKARREHEFIAAGEIAHVGAVLIHDGEPLDAPLLRAGLVHEHDAAVEIAFLAGQPFVNGIRNDVRDAAPIVRRGEILLAGELLSGQHVPKTEFGLQPPVGLAGDAPGRQRLRVDGAPVGKPRHGVDVDDLFQKSGRIDRRKQAAALEVAGDDLGNADARFRCRSERRRENRRSQSASAGRCPG